MRSGKEIRTYFLTKLHRSLPRPGMYGQTRGLDIYYLTLLNDLCFIDAQPPNTVKNYLQANNYGSALGVSGFLTEHIPTGKYLDDEIAAVYAEISFALGYLSLERVLSSTELKHCTTWLQEQATNKVWHHQDIIQLFGQPSFCTVGHGPTVNCYCDSNPSNWITFTYDKEKILLRAWNKRCVWSSRDAD